MLAPAHALHYKLNFQLAGVLASVSPTLPSDGGVRRSTKLYTLVWFFCVPIAHAGSPPPRRSPFEERHRQEDGRQTGGGATGEDWRGFNRVLVVVCVSVSSVPPPPLALKIDSLVLFTRGGVTLRF